MNGPCAKRQTKCTIVTSSDRRFIGTNDCRNPQPVCPRAPGEDYTKCRTICDQTGHAEVNAARAEKFAGFTGGIAYLEGHVYACESCMRALLAIGVNTLVIGPPPITSREAAYNAILDQRPDWANP